MTRNSNNKALESWGIMGDLTHPYKFNLRMERGSSGLYLSIIDTAVYPRYHFQLRTQPWTSTCCCSPKKKKERNTCKIESNDHSAFWRSWKPYIMISFVHSAETRQL